MLINLNGVKYTAPNSEKEAIMHAGDILVTPMKSGCYYHSVRLARKMLLPFAWKVSGALRLDSVRTVPIGNF